MSEDHEDPEDDENSDRSESGIFKIEKPPSIDRFFGRLNAPLKLLNLIAKIRLDKTKVRQPQLSNGMFDFKVNKTKKESWILPNCRTNFSFKDGKSRIAIAFKPYCLLPMPFGDAYHRFYTNRRNDTDLDLSFSTALNQTMPDWLPEPMHRLFPVNCVRIESKIKDKGQISMRLSCNRQILNMMKLSVDYTALWAKSRTFQHKFNCELTNKLFAHRYQVTQHYYLKSDSKCALKLGAEWNHGIISRSEELRIETGLQLCSEQLKPLDSNNQLKSERSEEDDPLNPNADESYIQEPENRKKFDHRRNPKPLKPMHHFKFYSFHKIGNRKQGKQPTLIPPSDVNGYKLKSTFAVSENIYNSTLKLDTSLSKSQLEHLTIKYLVSRGKLRLGGSYASKCIASPPSWELILERQSIAVKQGFSASLGVYYGRSQRGLRLWGKLSKQSRYEFLLQQRHQNAQSSNVILGVKLNLCM